MYQTRAVRRGNLSRQVRQLSIYQSTDQLTICDPDWVLVSRLVQSTSQQKTFYAKIGTINSFNNSLGVMGVFKVKNSNLIKGYAGILLIFKVNMS